QVLMAFHLLSHHVVFHNFTAPEQIQSVFPATFHSNLKNLITKILLEQSLYSCSSIFLFLSVSLPQLRDLEWRVDMKTASDSVSRMAVPTCILNMKVRRTARQTPAHVQCRGKVPNESSVTVELSKETLDTMLDGLGRIRDQLSAVAGK
ncbi:COMM domain-containing protein 9, partial [Silurus meridionalis]